MPKVLTDILAEVSCKLDPQLEQVQSFIEDDILAGPDSMSGLLDHAKQFQGKRLRAMVVLLVANGYGRVTKQHIQVAAFVEMIHTATLIHDDLLDSADRRRNLDCLHVEWGDHAAVLLGDWIYSAAFSASTQMEDQTASRVLADATKRVCRGEIEQNLARNNFDLSVEDYIAQIDGKTAALFEAASVLAAHYSGASASDCQALAKFGLLAGRAFQIADDLLDISGQQEVAGKSLGTDLANGKLTLPIMKLREHLDNEQLQQLRLMFGNGFDVGAQVSERWPDAWQAAVDATNETLSEYLAEANKCLDCFPNSIYANVLRDITSFLGERDY